MSQLFEGDFVGRAVTPEFGTKKGKPSIRIEMEIAEGDYKGRRVSFDGALDERSIKYTKKAMIALGWKGVSVSTFIADVRAAALTVPFRVEIATWDPQDGRPPRQWSSVRNIGGGSKPLEAISPDKIKDVDRWFAEAGDVGAPSNGVDDSIPF